MGAAAAFGEYARPGQLPDWRLGSRTLPVGPCMMQECFAPGSKELLHAGVYIPGIYQARSIAPNFTHLASPLMPITGTLFTVFLKLQDTVVTGTNPDGSPRTFRHPALQTSCMFAGETLCLLPYFLWRWRLNAVRTDAEKGASRSRHLRAARAFALPALCDAGATTMLNLGLFYTSASAFQMLRGTLVIFAGLLTILVLKRSLYAHHWVGITLICAGAALVGASSVIYKGHSAAAGSNPLLGNVLVVLAQLLAASQFIGEERLLTKYRAPVLLAVGTEGLWGLAIAAVALPLLSVVPGPDGRPLDSLPEALAAMRASPTLQWTTAGSVLSIGAFNFFGISVTKHLSGASRATIDACRTIFVWVYSISAGWEEPHVLQMVGFLVLLSGTSIYNEILRSCLPAAASDSDDALDGDLEDPLLLPSARGEQAPINLPPSPGRAPPPAVRTIRGPGGRPPRPPGHQYTMARSVTILPAALSPHSLASPSRRTLSALGEEAQGSYSDFEPGSETDSALASSRDADDGALRRA